MNRKMNFTTTKNDFDNVKIYRADVLKITMTRNHLNQKYTYMC